MRCPDCGGTLITVHEFGGNSFARCEVCSFQSPMPRVSSMSEDGYAYAACYTCDWKISGTGDSIKVAAICDGGRDHAASFGHRVGITRLTETEYDYRVERPS